MHRRCQPGQDGSASIYALKHPDLRPPKLFLFGGLVTFKPTKDQQDGAKIRPPGRKGLIVGYVTQPGGAFSGDYEVVDLRDVGINSARKRAKVWITKTIHFGDSKPEFPIAAARAIASQHGLVQKLADSMQFQDDLQPEQDGEDDLEDDYDEGDADVVEDDVFLMRSSRVETRWGRIIRPLHHLAVGKTRPCRK